MYSYYANNPIIKTLTDEQMEAAYRVRQMQYRIEDIKSHAEDMLANDDLKFAEYKFVCNAAQELAERYIYKYHDCSQAENDVMVSMIRDYCQDHAQEIATMPTEPRMDIPDWARNESLIDQDCIAQWGVILGRPLTSREEYLEIDDEIHEMVLDWYGRDPEEFFTDYPGMVKYRAVPEAKPALNAQINSAEKRSIDGTTQTSPSKETER